MSPVASTRWCPTPEQLMMLEQMYRGGIKTPNASQIQQITSHLSLYGRIEGKNVFYWFQNHKARDRQRLRKKLLTKQPPQHCQFQQQTHHQNPLLHLFDDASGLQQLHHYNNNNNSTSPFLQEGLHEAAPHVMMDYKKKMEKSQKEGMENWVRLRNQHELMNCMSYNSDTTSASTTTTATITTPHSCCSRPLITLELFPIKSTCTIKDNDH